MARPTLAQACARFQNRFTMQHVPAWARQPREDGTFYAPQFRTDAEWFANTKFPGEPEHPCPRDRYCYTSGQTWPLGQSLQSVYVRS